MIKRYTIIRRY